MPVPSSYNDITQNPAIRDHLGIAWYDRTFFVPKSWRNQRVWLRFSSVHYAAQIYVNGELAMNHEIGHLPFQKEVTHLVVFGDENRVTVACDNTLLSNTVPQGTVTPVDTDNGTTYRQSYTFDFFNYAGIHRPVTLYTTPKSYIDDVTIKTSLDDAGYGYVGYNVSVINLNETDELNVNVALLDKDGIIVAMAEGSVGVLNI
ncbi:Glycosyl hydrolases family 2, sugar binding domain [Popillia japonica]